MKTLLNNKKQLGQQETQTKSIQKHESAATVNLVYPQLKQQNRITSAYYSAKLIKGLPLSAQPIARPIKKVPQLEYPFFQEPPPIQFQSIHDEDVQQSKQTQEPEFEIRATTAPEGAQRKPKAIQDFRQLIQRVPQTIKMEPTVGQFVIQNKFPEYINDFDEFTVNPHVHKHMERLKSSNRLVNYQQLARNQSSKLERQRELIEKTISNRPVQSQQIKKRKLLPENRPKTTNYKRDNNLGDCWKDLAQKVVIQANTANKPKEESVHELEKSLTHLDLESNVLTQKEKEYIKKKRKQFLDDLRPYLEMKQAQAEKKRAIAKREVLLDKFDQHNSLLSELEDDGDLGKEESFEMLDDEIQIFNKPLVEQQNFFGKVDPINRSFEQQLKETQQKFEQMVKEDNKLYEDAQRNKIDKPAPFLKVGDHFSLDEINLVLRELKKSVDDRNYELLDGICKNLKFFWQFSKQTRVLLLKLSSLVFYKCGEYIFYEGDVGEQMYIILNGGCHVRIKNPHVAECNPIVSTLYTGQQFGELALIDPNTKINRPDQNQLHSNSKYTLNKIRDEMQRQEQQKEKAKNWWKKDYNEDEKQEQVKIQPKRSASIECAVDTYLLAISRDYFKSIILNVITSELEDKLKTLLTMPCFDFLSQMELIPIANLLESETYRLGQVILKEGEPQKYFYIVASGRCKCVKEEVFIRDLKVMRADDPNKKKPLKCGLINYAQVREDKKMRVKNTSLDLESVPGLGIPQSFQYQEIYKNKEYMAFKYHFLYREFVRGDFFMGRVLLNEYKLFDEDIMEMKYDLSEKSRLTVISDAAKTEVYKLDKGLFHLVSQPLKQHLIDGIKRKPEFDHIFDMEEAKKVKKWDAYKMNLFKAVMEQKELKN
ncbi:unnamed protein product [Paramecium pentaurelia]|uniref:Cyclic nucleotide-binding domain-containing protein n=1 Tax=Paramecium pentaurelia TaxID=43138 RepID=A0A8S1TW12_9CILI|nr:unnamed protein product [Paramecium pentaurelia]